uniref:Uncharacterized protein n=1 Tax=Pararge aegeria TaxID=116150 RepID=S4PY77_9NEOP
MSVLPKSPLSSKKRTLAYNIILSFLLITTLSLVCKSQKYFNQSQRNLFTREKSQSSAIGCCVLYFTS